MDSLKALEKVNKLTIKETIDLLIEKRDSMPEGDKKDYHDKLSNEFGKLCFYLMDIV